MPSHPNTSANAARLRHGAEARLKNQRTARPWPRTDADSKRLLHELQVHQVELEMQNAELNRARAEAEASAEKFVDLYDSAPLGYVTLNDGTTIRELNLAAARLLGQARVKLAGTPFSNWVAWQDRASFVRHLRTASQTEGQVTAEVELCAANGRLVPVQLCTVYRQGGPGQEPQYRTAITDITERKQAEEKVRRLNEDLEARVAARTAAIAALLEQSRHLQTQSRHLSHQLLGAQEAERKRISRDLHDQIAQTLVCVNMDLAALTRLPAVKTGPLKRRIARTQHLLQDTVKTLHRFTEELRPWALDELGLVPALDSCLADFKKRTGVRVRLTTFAGVGQLNKAHQAVLYRVAQAALTNVAQHAKASRVKVSIHKYAGLVGLEIKDDGMGFRWDGGFLNKHRRHLGLLGMKERVEMVGGAFSLESVPGQGTTLRADIPLDKGEEARRPDGTSARAKSVPSSFGKRMPRHN